MIAHVGNFDKRMRIGRSSPVLTGGSTFPAWINRSSDLLIKGLSLGSLVTLCTHDDNHSSPRDEKRIKGPEIPMDESMIGVRIKPTTFPRWNPAMEIPTALALSCPGNHLKIEKRTIFHQPQINSLNCDRDTCNFHYYKFMRTKVSLPWWKGAHGGQSNTFSQTKEGTNGQESNDGVVGSPGSQKCSQRPQGHTPCQHSFTSVFVHQGSSNHRGEYVSPKKGRLQPIKAYSSA